ncbi:hypothetical protein [Lewinella sp. W8]|uniref:hypothetical protein n=1 Tax=Lewinella sp. W8 TaxID=2528208 RepID=UPI001067975C|nr:hypothetical protein [Lewinella sp. W8]MTB50936.1 hypothetical protein [Lewinella sp. W8]
MRILFTLLITFTLTTFSLAQEYDTFISGDFSAFLRGEDDTDSKNSFFQFRPGIGKQLNPSWAVGATLNLTHSQTVFDGISTQVGSRRFQWGFGVWARRSLNPDNQFVVFLEPTVFFGSSRLSNLQSNGDWEADENAQTQAGVGSSLGLFYHVSPRFRLLTRLGGLSVERFFENGPINASTSLNLNFGIRSVSFGAEYLW